MKIFVFSGPTLTAEEGRAVLDAVYLPPASQGDVYSAARERPWGIGLVDGYFERVPAVWHKEILWAMSRGVHVFGSASMGALRAAELEPLGMVGVGAVFEAFRSGALEDDDEVTIIHGPAESGYRRGSEAMVDVRATLAAAEAEGVIDGALREALVGIAKATFYPERNYDAILRAAVAEGRSETRIAALARWLPGGRVDQKRADAFAMLELMAERSRTDPGPKQVRFVFQHTDAWEQVRCQIDRRPLDTGPGAATYQHDAVLDELRLEGAEVYQRERREAVLRSLLSEIVGRQGSEVGEALLETTLEAFCREQGLAGKGALAKWCTEQGLTTDELVHLMRDEAKLRRVRAIFEADVVRHLPDRLRVGGRYGALAARAREKQRLLASHHLDNPALEDGDLSEGELWRWYFEEALGREVPADLRAYAESAGFVSTDSLRRAVLRELHFRRLRA